MGTIGRENTRLVKDDTHPYSLVRLESLSDELVPLECLPD